MFKTVNESWQWFSYDMEMEQLQICSFCYRNIPIILVEVYVLFLYVKAIIKATYESKMDVVEQKKQSLKKYDNIDITMFIFNIVMLSVDVYTTILYNIGISKLVYLWKICYAFMMFVIFIRQVFLEERILKYIIASLGLLLVFIIFKLSVDQILPIKFILILISIAITILAFHQYYAIVTLFQNYRQKHQKDPSYDRITDKLIDKKFRIYHKMSPQLKYHLNLRKNFNIVVTISIWIENLLLFNIEENKQFFGQFLLLFLIEVFPKVVYYMFICVGISDVVFRSNNLRSQEKLNIEMRERVQ